MPGPSPAPCTFPDDFVHVALDTVRRRTEAVQVVQRFRLALLLHEQPDMKNDKAALSLMIPAALWLNGGPWSPAPNGQVRDSSNWIPFDAMCGR